MTDFRRRWATLARWQKTLAIAAVSFILYALAGFFLLPLVIQYVLEEKVAQTVQRRITVEDIRFNPLALTLDVTGLAMAGRDETEKFVSFDALHADLELSSLFRLAVVLRDIRLDGPSLHIRLDEKGETNFDDLLASDAPEEKSSGTSIFPVIVEPFEIHNGTVVFEDEARKMTHTVDQILFQVPRISSRKKDWEVFMKPVLSFRLNGASFHLQGQSIPFHDSLKTEFNLELLDLSLPQYWAYAPVSEKLALSKGSLTLENKLVFEQHEGKLPIFSIHGSVTGRDIEMSDNGQAVFSAERVQVVMEDLSILNRSIGLKSVSLDKPFVRVTRGKDGAVNWAGYFTAPQASGAKAPQGKTNATAATASGSGAAANATARNNTAATDAGNATMANATAQAKAAGSGAAQGPNATVSAPSVETTDDVARLLLQAPSVTITGGRVQFRDETPGSAFSKELKDLTVDVKDLSTAENATGEATLSLTTNAGESVAANATFSITPLRLKARVTARELDIPSYAAYFQEALPLRLASAKAGVQATLVLDGADALPRVEDGGIEVRGLKLDVSGASDAVTVKRVALNGIALDLKTQSVRTGMLTVEGPELATSEDKNGRSVLMGHLSSPAGQPSAAPQQKTSRPAEAAPAWTVQAEGVNVTGAAVRVLGKTSREPVRLKSFRVDSIAVDTGKRSAVIQKAALAFGLDVRLLGGGEVDLARLFSSAGDGAKTPSSSAGNTQNQAAQSDWNARLENFLVSDSQIRFVDETLASPANIVIDQIAFDAKKLSSDLSASIPLTFSCRVEETGNIRIEGDVTPATLASKGNLRLSRLPLALAAPYAAGVAVVDIPSGWLEGRLDWSIAKGAGKVSGALRVGDLRVTEGRSRTEVGGFKTLDVRDIQIGLSPLAVSVGEIVLAEPRGSLVIDADGNSTISRITPARSKSSGRSETSAPQKTGKEEGVSLEIKTLTVQKGRFSFTDKSLSPQFVSVITPVDMTVSDISLDPSRRIQIDLSAMIDGSAPMTAKGWVAPLKNPVETNSTVTLRNLDLVALSPYSSRFIAYPVTKGQLDWDMKVNSQSSSLTMGNAITARQLQLGDKVKSPDAIDAPVKLGLSLLRDMSGNIAITLPVRGDLNDPKFSIGGIVAQAFLGLILKAVTSPFSLLGSLIPEGSPDLDRLRFPAGLATPTPEAMTAMQTLADVLGKRPAMNLSIVGHADPVADKQALYDLQFLRKLQVIKYGDLSRREREETTPEQMEITEEEYPELLWEAYKDEPVEKEKNALGIHREVPREVQEEKLRELIRVTDEDLIRLAASRAEFVKNHLVGDLKVDPNRVFLGATGAKSLSGTHEVTVEIKQ